MRISLLLLTAFLLMIPSHGRCAEQGRPVLVCAVGTPGAPFHTPDHGSRYGWKGLFIDILDRVMVQELGMGLAFESYPWKRAQKQVEDGNADFLISVPTRERLLYSIASDEPLLKMDLHVYAYAGHPRLDEIRKIGTPMDIIRLDLTPVTNEGNGWHKENIDSLGIKTLYVPNDENLVQFLAKRRADIMIDAPISMNRLIRQYGLTADIVQTDVRFGPVNFHLLMSRKSRHAGLMPKINAAIGKLMADGTLEKLALEYARLNCPRQPGLRHAAPVAGDPGDRGNWQPAADQGALTPCSGAESMPEPAGERPGRSPHAARTTSKMGELSWNSIS